jgi:hypothetical protein
MSWGSSSNCGAVCREFFPKGSPLVGVISEVGGFLRETGRFQNVVGKTYKGFDGTYLCFGYDPREGFWMRSVDSERQTNVSERAIGRTFHVVNRSGPSRNEHLQWAKKRALDYVDTDWAAALASMTSDILKHPETMNLINEMTLGVATVRTPEAARRFIEGFAE